MEAEKDSIGMEGLSALIARTFGIHRLRPLQTLAIQSILAQRDLLLVLPTGGGKSLCYQAPALAREGLTVVLSPLISLMKDQVDGLTQNGVPAAMLTSAQDPSEKRRVHEDLEQGRLKLLFVAPERLLMPGFIEQLCERGLSAIAVDEAHCISHWGHDFRPEYRQLGELKRRIGLPIHAFTATATERVRADIVSQLGLVEPEILVGSCDRPNLTYRVRPRQDLESQVLEVVRRNEGRAGIVYCISRKETEKLAGDLARSGLRSAPYHAGLLSEERKRTQERFLNEEIDVVVATVAFGMGIDRTDVRFVIHAGLPKGIEQYSQETGRAGRDGLAAECLLLYSGADYHTWKSILERSHQEAPAEDVRVLEANLDRLGGMMNFATRFVCRHRQLAEYFGQKLESGEGCGACDVCLGELTLEPEPQILAQKILSGVVRCEQRYGASHVTAVLRGASTAAIKRAGHDGLSTYGLLRDRTQGEVRGWIDQLIGQDHLRTAGDRYPTLQLSASGVEVMRGERDVVLFAIPKAKGKSSARKAKPNFEEEGLDVDSDLFEALRGLRRDLARERGVPPYLVFNDRTLAQLAAHKPTTPEAFLGIKGVGEKKAQDLGPAFLEAIRAHAGSQERTSAP